MTITHELFAVFMERGHVPPEIPPALEPTRAMLEASGRRYLAAVANAAGSIALSIVADDVETVLFPCAALQQLLGSEARWTFWASSAALAEVSRLAGSSFIPAA